MPSGGLNLRFPDDFLEQERRLHQFKLPAAHAYWRIPTLLLCSGSGMAIGGWLAGVLYDHFGTYAPAFAAGIVANAVNLAILGALVFRHRSRSPRLA